VSTGNHRRLEEEVLQGIVKCADRSWANEEPARKQIKTRKTVHAEEFGHFEHCSGVTQMKVLLALPLSKLNSLSSVICLREHDWVTQKKRLDNQRTPFIYELNAQN
jgi:hypothetical protein